MKKRGIIASSILLVLTTALTAGVVFAKTDTTKRQSFLDEKFSSYVTNGTITQAQADTILADLKATMPERQKGFENGKGFGGRGGMMFMTAEEKAKFQAMTAEEKQAFLKEQKAKIDAMTDEEKAAYMEKMKENMPAKFPMIKLTDEQRTALAALTTNEEKIAYLEGIMTDDQKAKFEAMTDDQKTACISRLSEKRPEGNRMQGKGRGQRAGSNAESTVQE